MNTLANEVGVRLDVRPALGNGSLLLFPIFAASAPAPDYLCGAGVGASEVVAFHELDDGAVEELVEGLAPLDGQRGVVVAAGGRLSVDLFDKASTLNEYWDALVAGYAMDAIGGGPTDITVDEATAFLERVLRAEAIPVDATGEGTELHVDSDGIACCALRWNDAVVHMAAFEVAT